MTLLTPNAVDNRLLGLVDAQLELVQIGTEPSASVVKHQRELKVTHGVQCLCFLVKPLKGHLGEEINKMRENFDGSQVTPVRHM